MKENQKKSSVYKNFTCLIILFLFCSPAPRYTKKTDLTDSYKTSPQIKKTEISEPKREKQVEQNVAENAAADIVPEESEIDTDAGTPEELAAPEFTEEGLATYYSDRLQGRKTAFGERYNRHLFTAAHKTLPFNTMVKVTSLTNDKSVIVRINDRGPFSKNRIIDLSKAAAKEIDLISAGIMKVRIEVKGEGRTD